MRKVHAARTLPGVGPLGIAPGPGARLNPTRASVRHVAALQSDASNVSMTNQCLLSTARVLSLAGLGALVACDGGGRRPRIGMPSDFAVPAEFSAAVDALHRLTGQQSHPLIGSHDDEPLETPGVAI
ncbi:MAG: hypothetical protein ACT4P7_05065 [Gemmatimonadaceae bacterium]